MKYTVKHTCGHHDPVTLYGPHRERAAKLRALANRPCRACLTDITTERAHDQIDQRDLPPLVGS